MKMFDAIVITLGVLLGWGILIWQIAQAERSLDALHEQAIKHGAAEWVITDPASGKTEFRWKEVH